jgi:ATP-dependent DNA helicase RecG
MTSVSREKQLEAWLLEKEGEAFEFKKAANHYDFQELGKYCAALANEGGGKMILGVTDKRPRTIVGTTAFEQPERTRKGLCERIPLAIDFEEITHAGCIPGSRVLVFSIPPRPVGTPIKFGGRYWMRKEDSLVEMSEDKLREIFAESGHDFSAEVCPALAFAELDPQAIEVFRKRWIAKADKLEDQSLVSRLQSIDQNQLLTDAEAIIDGNITYAGLILFGSPAAVGKHLAQAETVFEYRSSDASGPAQDRKEFRRGFFGYHNDLWELINLRNDKQDFQDGLFVTPISTFNERPIREAVLNAISHRNYQLGGSIFIRQYPRRLEIDSPGGFPTGITPDNFLDRQNPRNRRIAEILTRCGLVERSGQGLNLIFEEMIKQSKPEPEFSRTDQYQVGLTLFGTVQDPAFVRFAEKISQETSHVFNTHDWLLMAAASRGDKLPRRLDLRISRLTDLGILERDQGRIFNLSRRFYEFAGKPADYTRKKGLGREHNLALLQKHIDDSQHRGATLDELALVLPSLPKEEVRGLLRILKRRGLAKPTGMGPASRWMPIERDSNAS